ncbi:DUF2934 domain-containing protein [Telmatospirillum siberiense]|uniref:DUF2934 domain-containing protein n=1 Tax=Telmatospirillum siberiense TaxID=382514 RepID=A0A2N3PUD2_9PROT|nr:DUF2934 domain-containing protein [Telmatospirillum siberiense]PKU23998.1 hypothetical protein CWS72_14155 [Telmatospirillum siberiense]
MNVTDYDKISLRAFQIWEAEGRPEGRELEHWLRAEIELRVVPSPAKARPSAAPKGATAKAVPVKKTGAAKTSPKVAAPKAVKPAAKTTAPKRAKV